MADRVLNVKVTGDTSGLGRSFQKASKDSSSFGSHMQTHVVGTLRKVGQAAEIAGGLIGISFVAALGDGVRIAAQNQVALTKLKKSVDNSGLSWKHLGHELRETQDRLAGISGFTNTDLETSLAQLITTTGNVTSAQHLQNEAMDLARAKGMKLSQASTILSKVWNGNVTSLTRLGIGITKTTKNYDAYMASTTHATAAGKAAAKQADLVANRQNALAQLQKKFGGSYQAYANTASGALARIRASADILLERLGAVLLPYLNRFASWFAKNLPMIQQKGTMVFGALRDVILHIVDAVKAAIGFYQRWSIWIQAVGVFVGTLVLGFEAYLGVMKLITIATKIWTGAQLILNAVMDANPFAIAVIAAAALAAGFVILWHRSSTFRTIVKGVLHDIQIAFGAVTGFIHDHWGSVSGFIEARFRGVWNVISGIYGFIKNHWQTILAIMTGGWSIAVRAIIQHWGDIKSAANHVVSFIVARWGNVKQVFSTFRHWVQKLIIGPIQWIIDKAKEAWSWISKIGLDSGSLGGAAGRQARGGSAVPQGAAQKYASSQMSRYGWGQDQMASLIPLWNGESGWNNMAYNSSSGATGIPQSLPYSKMPQPAWLPFQGGHADMKSQVNWGLGYIHGSTSYGSPSVAYSKWLSRSPHWYDKGGVVPGPRGVHRPIWAAGGETVLPTHKGGGGMPQVIVVPVMLERDMDVATQKALTRISRSGNAPLAGRTIR